MNERKLMPGQLRLSKMGKLFLKKLLNLINVSPNPQNPSNPSEMESDERYKQRLEKRRSRILQKSFKASVKRIFPKESLITSSLLTMLSIMRKR
jgi:hypothetical protein